MTAQGQYQNHFTHLRLATFDLRGVFVGSANLNFRSLEDDKEFEVYVFIESEKQAGDAGSAGSRLASSM